MDSQPTTIIEQDLVQQDGHRQDLSQRYDSNPPSMATAQAVDHYPSASPPFISSVPSPSSFSAAPEHRAFSMMPSKSNSNSNNSANAFASNSTSSSSRRHAKWGSRSGSSPEPSPAYSSAQPQSSSSASSTSGNYYATSSLSSSTSSATLVAHTHHHHSHPYHSPRRHHVALPQNQQQQQNYQRVAMHEHTGRRSPTVAVTTADWQHSRVSFTHHRSGSDGATARGEYYYPPAPLSPRGEHPHHHPYGRIGAYPGDDDSSTNPTLRQNERRSSGSGLAQSMLLQRRSFGTLDSAQAQYEQRKAYLHDHYMDFTERTDEVPLCIACRMTNTACDGRFPCGQCASTNTRCMYQHQHHSMHPHRHQHRHQDSTDNSKGRNSSSPPRRYHDEVAYNERHMEIESWDGSTLRSTTATGHTHGSSSNSGDLPPLYLPHPPLHHPVAGTARRRSNASPPAGSNLAPTSSTAGGSGSTSLIEKEAGNYHIARSAMSSPGLMTIPPLKSLFPSSSSSPLPPPSSSVLTARHEGGYHHGDTYHRASGGKTTLPSLTSLSTHDRLSTSSAMDVDQHANTHVLPSRSPSPPPSPSYPMTSPSTRDPNPNRYPMSNDQQHSTQAATSMQSLSAAATSSLVASSLPASLSSGPQSSHTTGQSGVAQRSQRQRPILPFANPHVSRARSTSSSGSSSSPSATSRPPAPLSSQPAMASLSQGSNRNHSNRGNISNGGLRRASYSHDPLNSINSSTPSKVNSGNRPPSPLPLIITLSSSSIRARKNAIEMDNIQRASLLYTDFMARVKESLTRTTTARPNNLPSTECGAQSLEVGATITENSTTAVTTATTATSSLSTTPAAAIAITCLDSIRSECSSGEHADAECFGSTSLPAPTIGFDPTTEAIVALEDLSKTGMLHAMIQRYFEWIHPQFMIFNKNHFLLRFWSQYGPFPAARELHEKLHHNWNRDSSSGKGTDMLWISSPSTVVPVPDYSFTAGPPPPTVGFLSDRSCPLSPLLLWSMVALVARHIDDRECLKAPIQESQKRVREGMALLNLADKREVTPPQQQRNERKLASGDVVMAETYDSTGNCLQEEQADKPPELGANRTPEDYKDRGEQYFRWATELLKEQHAESSLVVVQSHLLLREYAVMAGMNSQASMYASTAITMAMDLGWHKMKRPEAASTTLAASSTTTTSVHSSEPTTSIAMMGNISADSLGASQPTTPSGSSVSSMATASSTLTTTTSTSFSSESSNKSTGTTGTTSIMNPAKIQAATAAAVSTSSMVATVAPATSTPFEQGKEQLVAEEEQRLCWGMCFIIDRWTAISTGRAFAIPIHVVDKSVFLAKSTSATAQKPKDGGDESDVPVKMPGLQMRTKLFYEQQCRQALVIDEIQQFLMTWTEDLFVNTKSFDRLAIALDNWYRALPSWMTLSNDGNGIGVQTSSPATPTGDTSNETASNLLPDILRTIEWAGSAKGPGAKQLEMLNKDISLAILMDISYHTVRILLHRPFLRTNLRHPPCSPTRASYACAQSANAITGYAEQLLNQTALSPSLLMRHLFCLLTAAGVQLTNANLDDEPRLSTPAKINLLKSIRVLRDSDRTSIGRERFMAILEEFFPNQMKVMYKRT